MHHTETISAMHSRIMMILNQSQPAKKVSNKIESHAETVQYLHGLDWR